MIPHFLPKRKNSVLAVQGCSKVEKTVQADRGGWSNPPPVALDMAIQRERAGLKGQRQVTMQQMF
jgi:hypothetical protein